MGPHFGPAIAEKAAPPTHPAGGRGRESGGAFIMGPHFRPAIAEEAARSRPHAAGVVNQSALKRLARPCATAAPNAMTRVDRPQ